MLAAPRATASRVEEREQGQPAAVRPEGGRAGQGRCRSARTRRWPAWSSAWNAASPTATAGLLRLHRLDPGKAGRINARVRENFKVRAPIDKAQAGLLGAVVSGAATGLSADLMAGGLTLGGGALLGAIVGALTMAGAAWGFNTSTDREHPTVQFADPFLRTLLVGAVLRYLAVAHFGRGRGNFVEGEAPAFWQAEVEAALAPRDADLAHLWKAVRAAPDDAAAARLVEEVAGPMAIETLERLYPGSAAQALSPRPV
jgi:hypothetical protein